MVGPVKYDKRERTLEVGGRKYRYSSIDYEGSVARFYIDADELASVDGLQLAYIPKHVAIETNVRHKLPLVTDLKLFRMKASFSLYFRVWSYPVDSRVFLRFLAELLESKGWQVSKRHTDMLEALFEGDYWVAELIHGIQDIMMGVDRYLEEVVYKQRAEVAERLRQIQNMAGIMIAQTLSLKGPFAMIVSSLYPAAVAKILYGMGIVKADEKLSQQILGEFQEHEDSVNKTLQLLGLTKYMNGCAVLTDLGSMAARAIVKAMASQRPVARQQTPFIKASEVLHHVVNNIRSMAAQHSPSLRRLKNTKQYKTRLDEIGKKIETLTFPHIIALMNIAMRNNLGNIFQDEVRELVQLGLVSYKLKLRPLGIWVVKLVKSFTMKKQNRRWEELWKLNMNT
ncbi:MAG: hypothetical protein QXH35_05105 [Nitrososphaerota archaeon]